MAAVEFHVLSEGGPDARLRYACRLAEESVEQGLTVYLQTSSSGETLRVDEMLWTYNDRSFLPHEINAGAAPTHEQVRVMLGELPAPPSHRGLLINLTEAVPPDLDAYGRIAEIVDVDAERKRTARERYKQYRERGCVLESKNV